MRTWRADVSECRKFSMPFRMVKSISFSRAFSTPLLTMARMAESSATVRLGRAADRLEEGRSAGAIRDAQIEPTADAKRWNRRWWGRCGFL